MVDKTESLVTDAHPVLLENADGVSDVILIAEHAGRQLPQFTGSLGLDDESMSSHIAWDLGVAELSRLLSRLLDAPLIMQRYSRLVCDCNRAFEAADVIVTESDNVIIAGNINLDAENRQKRYEEIYWPFEDAIEKFVMKRKSAGVNPIIVTIHSFTPVYKEQQRHVDLGVLHDTDSRLADALLEQSKSETQFSSARNEPYTPADGVTHTLIKHGVNNGLLNVMFEVRNDLLSNADSHMLWAQRLYALLQKSLSDIMGR